MAVKVVRNFVPMFPDEALDKIVPELVDHICNGCPVKHLCPMHDKEDPTSESCKALTILERFFLTGKISFKGATVPENIPPQDKKIMYNLEGF